MQTLDCRRKIAPIRDNIEPTLSRNLLTLLWNETNLVRTNSDCDFDDLRRVSHLEIQLRHDASSQSFHIAVLNMPAIGTEMGGYSMGTGALTNRGCEHGIRLGILRLRSGRVTRLPQSRDMINIYPKTQLSHGANQFRGNGAKASWVTYLVPASAEVRQMMIAAIVTVITMPTPNSSMTNLVRPVSRVKGVRSC